MAGLMPYGSSFHSGCLVQYWIDGSDGCSVQAQIVKGGKVRYKTTLTDPQREDVGDLVERLRAAAFDFIDHKLQQPEQGKRRAVAIRMNKQLWRAG